MTDKTANPSTSLMHVSVAPHVRRAESVQTIMISVIIALVPAFAGSLYYFGVRSLFLVCASILGTVGAEWLINAALKKPHTIKDASALITGVLLAFTLPPDLSPWMATLGGVFAIGVVKTAFGGLGNNFLNPALAGRAFLTVSYPAAMTHWSAPLNGTLSGFPWNIEGLTSATPLAYFKHAALSGNFRPLVFKNALANLFWGNCGGSIGETSALLLVLGACFLWYKRIIGFSIPVLFIGTVFVGFWVTNGTGRFFSTQALIAPLYQVLSGGLLLGALFMAGDPATSPITTKGKAVFGLGCGLLTLIFRKFGGYPEGVCYAILLMNCASPLIDRGTRPRIFGEVKTRE
jgi:electron transport complex protein RnfD